MQEKHLPEARKALAPLEADSPDGLVIDLTDGGDFGEIHISFLLLCKMLADKHGSKMVLAGISEQGRELLHLLGPPTAWPQYGTRTAALAALGHI